MSDWIPGRVVDLSVITDTLFDGSSGPVGFSLSSQAQPGGAAVAGVQKAVQRFLTLLFTEAGSVLADPSRGTSLLADSRRGVIRTEVDAELYFKLAVADALDYSSNAASGLPDDERIEDVSVEWLDLSNHNLLVGARLTTAAGVSREIILPVTEAAS